LGGRSRRDAQDLFWDVDPIRDFCRSRSLMSPVALTPDDFDIVA
jgi:hypothetical protein